MRKRERKAVNPRHRLSTFTEMINANLKAKSLWKFLKSAKDARWYFNHIIMTFDDALARRKRKLQKNVNFDISKGISTLSAFDGGKCARLCSFSFSIIPFGKQASILLLFSFFFDRSSNMKKSFESNLLIKGTLCPLFLVVKRKRKETWMRKELRKEIWDKEKYVINKFEIESTAFVRWTLLSLPAAWFIPLFRLNSILK